MQTADLVSDPDKAFTDKRTESRREDAHALASKQVSPAELQDRNSIISKDFWNNTEIDWTSLALGQESNS